MNRGSAYVKVRVWLVNRDGSINKRSSDIAYGHSAVTDMNTNSQREIAFQKAKNQALKQYRNEHKLNSDSEINYHLISSGIISVGMYRGKKKRVLKSNHISPSRKRELHKESYLGKDKVEKLSDVKRMEKQQTREEYSGEKSIVSNKYVIDTGYIKANKVKVKQKTVKGYWGMNNSANKELDLQVRMNDNDILIAKSLKGKKKRQVIAHEVEERKLMKKGMKYKSAHKRALKIERKVK
jgi:hypothetical protein